MAIAAAALSLGAQAPAAAQAEVTFTASQRVTLEGERAGPVFFAAGGIEKVCPRVALDGSLRGNSTTLRLRPLYGKPIYSGCFAKALGGLHVKFASTGCTYLLHADEKIGGKERWRASVDIDCPHNYFLQWNVYENTKAFELGYVLCTTQMLPQTGLESAELSNVAGSPNEIAIQWDLSSIEYKAYGSSLFCGPLGTVRRDATYRDHIVIAATDSKGRPIDFSISGAARG